MTESIVDELFDLEPANNDWGIVQRALAITCDFGLKLPWPEVLDHDGNARRPPDVRATHPHLAQDSAAT